MNEYEETALANAIAQKLSAATVKAMGYAQIAALAEVELDENGGHPNDPEFYYTHVRRAVYDYLDENEVAIAQKQEEDEIKAFLTLSASSKTVYRNEDGDIVIK